MPHVKTHSRCTGTAYSRYDSCVGSTVCRLSNHNAGVLAHMQVVCYGDLKAISCPPDSWIKQHGWYHNPTHAINPASPCEWRGLCWHCREAQQSQLLPLWWAAESETIQPLPLRPYCSLSKHANTEDYAGTAPFRNRSYKRVQNLLFRWKQHLLCIQPNSTTSQKSNTYTVYEHDPYTMGKKASRLRYATSCNFTSWEPMHLVKHIHCINEVEPKATHILIPIVTTCNSSQFHMKQTLCLLHY